MDQETESTQNTAIREIFGNVERTDQGNIYKKRDILQIDHLPSENRIVGRDEQIQTIAGEISPIIAGEQPNSVVVYGKTGCGKSLVSKYVINVASEEAEEKGVNIATGYINCQQAKGTPDALSRIGSEINPKNSPESFPRLGLSEAEYFERIWTVLQQCFDGAVIVLDEVDKLKNDDILMALSRAGEDGSVDVPIGVIAVSNKINFSDQMSERTKSSFGHNGIVFDSYDAIQIKQILLNRKDAFKDGVIDDSVIKRVAALSAQEHGDARKAMRLLRYAGDEASKNGANEVTVDHIDAARQSAETDRLRELVSGLPPHSKYILIALANLTRQVENKEWFTTMAISETYKTVCEKETQDPLSVERRRQLLHELCFLEVATRRNAEDMQGTPKEYKLQWNPETVLQLD